MKVYIGIGSNKGDRLKNIKVAVNKIKQTGMFYNLRLAPIYETPALLFNKKLHRNMTRVKKDTVSKNILSNSLIRPYLNTVLEVKCDIKIKNLNLQAITLLQALKKIEKDMGRSNSLKWFPRIIDLDILLFDSGHTVKTKVLQVPHPELVNRSFVLAPLKELNPLLMVPHTKYRVLQLYRRLQQKLPLWMVIVNVTPDSFSDGGSMTMRKFKTLLNKLALYQTAILDLGAESTRPGAHPISSQQEWKRLKPYIECFFKKYDRKTMFRPLLSVDTRHALTAQKAIHKGADIINDVSGLNSSMLKVLQKTRVQYVLTHSISVPASKTKILSPFKDPVLEIKKWFKLKLNVLKAHNIDKSRIILDLGIGFGKNSGTSLEILQRIDEFLKFPNRLMLGVSRKSFIKSFSETQTAKQLDPESLGLALALAQKGVDILRVHAEDLHARTFNSFCHV